MVAYLFPEMLDKTDFLMKNKDFDTVWFQMFGGGGLFA